MNSPRPSITPERLREMAEQVAARYPNATLVKNDVGNLSIIDADEYVGWLDLGSGEVDFFTDTDTP